MYSWQYASQPRDRALQILKCWTPMEKVKVLHQIYICKVLSWTETWNHLIFEKKHTMRILFINFTKRKCLWQLLTFWFFGVFFRCFYTFFLSATSHTVNQSYVRSLFFPTLTCILRYLISPNNDMSISFIFTAESIGIYCFKNSCLLLSED